ncbi:hypothetical protein R1CP_36665 (plasmid) [Rhodococcus opacus]|uniref:Uncharacterized protein n=1 Tax=Rhodococcus opacus TaxID=37919 RepID=A0A1B1KH67_RHOOP|nr:hypothetical protein [Rhodococcus opacus]ANS31939.1 hypothetical protein R1CP_36665 [Rhodococcus opacus]
MEKNLTFDGAGVATLSRKLPMRGGLRSVCFEVNLMTRLVLEGEEDERYLRTIIAGIDEVGRDGSTPRGYGSILLEDPDSLDRLVGRVEWFIEGGRNKGRLVFEEGTGKWANASGTIPVNVEYCTLTNEDDITTDDATKGLAFISGAGPLKLA